MTADPSPIPHAILDRDLSADPVKARQIRSSLAHGCAIGAEHFDVGQMAFLLAELTIEAVEIQKVDNDAAVGFLRALADLLDERRPVSARRLADETRKTLFVTICQKARELEAKVMAETAAIMGGGE